MAITQEEKEYLLEAVSIMFHGVFRGTAINFINGAGSFQSALDEVNAMLPSGQDFVSVASSYGVRTPEHILLMSNSDAAKMYRQSQELIKVIQVKDNEIERRDAAVEELERAQAARLKAEELAKSRAEKILELEKLLEEEYVKSKEKDDELIECLEKANFVYNCGNQFSGEEGNAYKDGL